MRIYEVSYQDDGDGRMLEWAATLDGVKAIRARWREEYGVKRGQSVLQQHNIPPNSAGVVEFLNSRFTRDNG